ncbi:hypothetical protein Cgig2_011579 [Carnegiea gigantea]|uniref:Uncharacterized protein n=1 Tax=Carnegiea gigantea TaxID=171969 RepID=A0A9Q1K7Q1_9CARY|nr:hypothetical protein Cgig2_011579 [Carnegiea gigantea]
MESLSKIGSSLGIPIKTDKYTKEKTMLKYARLLTEIQIKVDFPEFIEFINEHNVVMRQRVEYEWEPTRCSHCKMFGHKVEECRKKTQPHQIDEEGFIKVKKRAATKLIGNKEQPTQIPGRKQITYAIAAVAIHYIWRIRNEKIFSNHQIHVQAQFKLTKEHIIQRVLTLNRFSRKYHNCIEKVIG